MVTSSKSEKKVLVFKPGTLQELITEAVSALDLPLALEGVTKCHMTSTTYNNALVGDIDLVDPGDELLLHC